MTGEGRAPHQILVAWSEARFELVFTPDTHEEYRRVAAELANGHFVNFGLGAPSYP